jgi:hypothetical protein
VRIINLDLARSDRQGDCHRVGHSRDSFRGWATPESDGIDEIVRILIENRLKIVLGRIGQNAMPVAG